MRARGFLLERGSTCKIPDIYDLRPTIMFTLNMFKMVQVSIDSWDMHDGQQTGPASLHRMAQRSRNQPALLILGAPKICIADPHPLCPDFNCRIAWKLGVLLISVKLTDCHLVRCLSRKTCGFGSLQVQNIEELRTCLDCGSLVLDCSCARVVPAYHPEQWAVDEQFCLSEVVEERRPGSVENLLPVSSLAFEVHRVANVL